MESPHSRSTWSSFYHLGLTEHFRKECLQALWSQRGSLEGLPTLKVSLIGGVTQLSISIFQKNNIKFTKVFTISKVCWQDIKMLLNCTRVQEVASPSPSEAFPSTSYQTLTLCTELTFICNLTKATVMLQTAHSVTPHAEHGLTTHVTHTMSSKS